MYCKKCGEALQNSGTICRLCGTDNSPIKEAVANNAAKKEAVVKHTPRLSAWHKLSIVSLLCGIITFIIGVYKMAVYDNGDYSYDPVNAYVGGDAYNYIINGTYATAFFVLTAMFILSAIGLVIIDQLKNERRG